MRVILCSFVVMLAGCPERTAHTGAATEAIPSARAANAPTDASFPDAAPPPDAEPEKRDANPL